MYNINPLIEKVKNLFLSIGERFNKYFNYNDVKFKLLNLSAKPKPFKEVNTSKNSTIPKESFSAAALAVLVLDHGIELMNFAKNKVSPTQETILQKG